MADIAASVLAKLKKNVLRILKKILKKDTLIINQTMRIITDKKLSFRI